MCIVLPKKKKKYCESKFTSVKITTLQCNIMKEELLNQMWMVKKVFFQETVCKWKSFQEDNEGFVNAPEKPPI